MSKIDPELLFYIWVDNIFNKISWHFVNTRLNKKTYVEVMSGLVDRDRSKDI